MIPAADESTILALDAALRFGEDDAVRAYDEWGFNCGPAALCALLNLTPGEVRPHLKGFDAKRYVNPTMMFEALSNLGAPHRQTYRADDLAAWVAACRRDPHAFAGRGLVRVQFGGPWTNPGVPMRARYRHTHWAAFAAGCLYDVNHAAGWLTSHQWGWRLLPHVIRHGAGPKADGLWWPTHVIEVTP